METIERAIRLHPRESEFYHQQGLTYLYLRKYEMADVCMDRCLEIAPEHLIAKINKIAIVLFSRGDIEEAKRMLEGIPDINVKAYQTIFMNLYERNYKKALEHLESIDVDTQVLRGLYFNKDLFYASIYYLQNQPVLAKSHAERAREDIENRLRERPKDRGLHVALGKVYAYLGLKEEAIRQGKLAVELVPVSKDAVEGPDYVSELANIYVIVGEYEEAINQIDYLLSIPSYFSVQLLRLDPVWDPLREHPRFQQLLKKYPTS